MVEERMYQSVFMRQTFDNKMRKMKKPVSKTPGLVIDNDHKLLRLHFFPSIYQTIGRTVKFFNRHRTLQLR